MKKILVPTDFSDQATYASELAAHLAHALKAELIFLHVVVDATMPTVHYTGEVALPDMQDRLFVLKLIERGKDQMAELVERKDLQGLKIHTEVHVGDIYYGVKEIIAEKEIDLVIMGTKGSGGFEEFLIGSNAERVVRHAACPVITIHERMTSFDFKRIVFASALEKDDQVCAPMLLELSKAFQAHLHLVRINTPNNFKPDYDTRPKLKALAEKCGFSDYSVHVYNDASEESGILNFAEEVGADLIAMATHGRTGLAHLLVGSLAETVVNHTQRPVMTYVSKDKK
jgi:nucleotide-binding universal stress UspA family protein